MRIRNQNLNGAVFLNRKCLVWVGVLTSLTALLTALAVAGCGAHVREPGASRANRVDSPSADLRATIISTLRVSPTGRFIAFELSRPARRRVVCVLALTDGRLLGVVRMPESLDLAGWCADEAGIYVSDSERIMRYDIATGKASAVRLILPCQRRDEVYISSARYIGALDTFLVQAEVGTSGPILYAVARSTGKAAPIAPGRLRRHALGVANGTRSLTILSSELPAPEERGQPTANPRLTVYHYPPVEAPITFTLHTDPGTLGFGAISPDGRWSVLPCRLYPLKPARSRIYLVDLQARRTERSVLVDGGVWVARIGQQARFVVVGPSALATIDLVHFELKPVRGGPVGVPTSIATTRDGHVVVATGTNGQVYLVDVQSGKRRVIWNSARLPGDA